jgi:hypothetical protein
VKVERWAMLISPKQIAEWKVLAETVRDTARANRAVAGTDVVTLCDALATVLAEVEAGEQILAEIEDAQSRDRASCIVCGGGPKHEPHCRLAAFMRARDGATA